MRTLLTLRLVVSVGVTLVAIALVAPATWSAGPPEAPTGFNLFAADGESSPNGFAEEFCNNQRALTDSPNSPEIPDGSQPGEDDECDFATAAEEFTGPETEADGLGPIFNGNGCGECHLVPILGGSSQILEKRAGFFNGTVFTDHPGGSLIQDRAILSASHLQEFTIPARTNVRTFRGSISVLGDGFVEAIANATLRALSENQPNSIRGTLIDVPVDEKPGATRTGRFGWKNQQASLVSFSADAYVNEMGITSPLQPNENTSNGTSVAAFDLVPLGHPNDPDDEGVDVELFALFMRSTKAPPRGRITSAVLRGESAFRQIGCERCHTQEIVTAAPGSSINGGALKVTEALGNKTIHPFGDFLLHDIGTGDGIVQNGGQGTRNMVRTAPLWGLRVRSRFMHDGDSLNVFDAIDRHRNQANSARQNFNALSSSSKNDLVAFLLSL